MPPSKIEHVGELYKALAKRRQQLRDSEELERQAHIKSESLRAAVQDLIGTIGELVGDGEVSPEILARAPHEVQQFAAAHRRAEGTLLERVLAYVQSASSVVDANEISHALGINIDTTRTVLSKLRARDQIQRLKTGQYCSPQYAQDVCGEGEPEDAHEVSARSRRT